MIKVLCTQLIEQGINKILALHPHPHLFLQKHHGKVIKLEITDINRIIFFVLRPHHIHACCTYSNCPDTLIQGTSFSLLKQILSNATANKLLVEGDLELAHDMQSLVQDIDIAGEELLSYLVGDFMTHRMTMIWHELKSTAHHISTRTKEDLLDYIQEEKQFLPTREEVEDFYEEILSLRQTLDRLEARLCRLKGAH